VYKVLDMQVKIDGTLTKKEWFNRNSKLLLACYFVPFVTVGTYLVTQVDQSSKARAGYVAFGICDFIV